MNMPWHRSIGFVCLAFGVMATASCDRQPAPPRVATPPEPAPSAPHVVPEVEPAATPIAVAPTPSPPHQVHPGEQGKMGHSPRPRRESNMIGGLVGDQVGDAYGQGGLGLSGKSATGGATGGTIGLGTIGTIGKGYGSGAGYGRGGGFVGGSVPLGNNVPFDSEAGNTESYAHQAENDFRTVKDAPLSTFSVDVDTASYSNVRRFLDEGQLPPSGAVRVEELINYFPYQYSPPTNDEPFAANVEVASCPWAETHRLVRVGIKARDLDSKQRPASNLVFLVDVSGSMMPDNKLPLLKRSLRLVVDSLDARDRVSIVVYAGSSGVALPPTSGNERAAILKVLDRLESGGSTNGAGGIAKAYELASKSFIQGGSNRVILATDGDFNVGITDEHALVTLIEKEAKRGVFLSVLGFGRGNVKDSTMEKLADRGNGNYAYIDTLQEARKVLVEQMTGTLITVAKDVKLQIEFNPALVQAYRQIGYENRQLKAEDFNNDKIDAGDIGAGHTVTALYEVVPAGVATKLPTVDELKYSQPAPLSVASITPGELATVKIRYKPPTGDKSKLSSFTVTDSPRSYTQASVDYKFAAAVAELGMLLRGSKLKGNAKWEREIALAKEGRGDDPHGYRAEMVRLSEKAQALAGKLARR